MPCMKRLKKYLSLPKIVLPAVILLAILGGCIVIYSTANGPSGASDSVAYLVSARNLLKGLGIGYYAPDGNFYRDPLHPPAYVIALSAAGFMRLDIVDAARVLDVLLFAATIFIAGFLFYLFGSKRSFPILAILMIGTYPTLLGMYTSAESESLFFPLYLGSIVSLLGYLKSHQIRWLVGSAVLVGLIASTRYIGAAMIPVGFISIFFFASESPGQKLKKAIFYSCIACLPLLLWGIALHFNIAQANVGGGISFDLGVMIRQFQQMRASVLELIWNWIPFQIYLPNLKSNIRYTILVLTLIGVVVVALLAIRRIHQRVRFIREDHDFQIFCIFGLSFLAYAIFLVFSYLVYGLPARWDDRQLLPIYISAVLSLMGAFALWQSAWFQRNHPWARILPWLIALVFIFSHFPQTLSTIEQARAGNSYISYRWRNSKIMNAVRSLPPTIPIISNYGSIILLWADRPAYELTENMKPGFVSQNKPYGSDLTDDAQAAFRERGGALVILGNKNVLIQQIENGYGPINATRQAAFFDGLVLAWQSSEGLIYYFPGN